MSRYLLGGALTLLLLSPAVPVSADQYDDCMENCRQRLASCIDQAHTAAGNVQEEQELLASCERSKEECNQACTTAEVQPEPSPAPAE